MVEKDTQGVKYVDKIEQILRKLFSGERSPLIPHKPMRDD